MKGKRHTEQSKQKNRLSHLGRVPWNKGKKMSAELCEKNRAAHLGQVSWRKKITVENLQPSIFKE